MPVFAYLCCLGLSAKPTFMWQHYTQKYSCFDVSSCDDICGVRTLEIGECSPMEAFRAIGKNSFNIVDDWAEKIAWSFVWYPKVHWLILTSNIKLVVKYYQHLLAFWVSNQSPLDCKGGTIVTSLLHNNVDINTFWTTTARSKIKGGLCSVTPLWEIEIRCYCKGWLCLTFNDPCLGTTIWDAKSWQLQATQGSSQVVSNSSTNPTQCC